LAARPAGIEGLVQRLKRVNEAILQTEDDIRSCEVRGDFSPRFLELARSICHDNEERAALKRRISELCGAARHEEEQDPPYGVWNEASA
jgi:hypothetical protein